MTYLLIFWIWLRQYLRSAARRRNSQEARAEIRSVDDRIVGGPACSVGNRRVAKEDSRAAVERDLAHLGLGEKAQRLPIGREERLRRVFRAGNGRARLPVERTEIQLLRFARNRGDKHNLRPVRGDRKG